jgi:hypothetical protein
MVVTEPMLDSWPYIAGEHIAVTPLSNMVDTIIHYLENEQERSRLAAQAHAFVTQDLHIQTQIGIILARAREVNAQKRVLPDG